jgi:hypothetical protein
MIKKYGEDRHAKRGFANNLSNSVPSHYSLLMPRQRFLSNDNRSLNIHKKSDIIAITIEEPLVRINY